MRVEKQIAAQPKPTIAVHKFSSCDGCQLAFLNAGPDLITLSSLVNIVHFAEAGPVNTHAKVDIAFVEGSISTPEERERIQQIRKNTKFLITIGACATSGGIQALRNLHNAPEWLAAIYASPDTIAILDSVTAIANHVNVDLELWGCPVNGHQVLTAVRALLFGVKPKQTKDKICLECKRMQHTCVIVAHNKPCMGPVTQTGCGAICPRIGRDCYGCYGPAENVNTSALAQCFSGLGLLPHQVVHRFQFINSAAPEFADASDVLGQQQDYGGKG